MRGFKLRWRKKGENAFPCKNSIEKRMGARSVRKKLRRVFNLMKKRETTTTGEGGSQNKNFKDYRPCTSEKARETKTGGRKGRRGVGREMKRGEGKEVEELRQPIKKNIFYQPRKKREGPYIFVSARPSSRDSEERRRGEGFCSRRGRGIFTFWGRELECYELHRERDQSSRAGGGEGLRLQGGEATMCSLTELSNIHPNEREKTGHCSQDR